ncbi:hypothetical protein N7468_001714 [Penicillium chermesinum]|uniref:LITAF domain-containing protein n=1 Tax=Penicillium chermesinum TaxID=63820 RepID=A0A9W9PIT2_9EURO|nr:uncharacterized protein N7468_001714 [Penicillium chermesinum]KAJ5246731.1 hypothetical protein N7468_001714 [Penicillium chermesinum]
MVRRANRVLEHDARTVVWTSRPPERPTRGSRALKGIPGPTRGGRTPVTLPSTSPSDVKAYPGQPIEFLNGGPQPYVTPFGQPTGYATAVPLHSLQSAPAPVDCPSCGYREMTKIEGVSGNTAQ